MTLDVLNKTNISNEVLNVVNAVILVMNKDGQIVLFNKASEILTGYSFEEVENKYPWDIFIPAEQVKNVRDVFSRLTSGDFPNSYTNAWLTKTGEERLLDWSNTAITDESGDICFIIATGIDITEKRAAEAEIKNHLNNLESLVEERTAELAIANEVLKEFARTDGLTGVFNRRQFNEVLDAEVGRCKRSGEPLSLLMCDVDHFKIYNDTYGHVAGDYCLIEIATAINNYFTRSSDFVARYGGEEFAIILPGISAEQASALGKGLVKKIQDKQMLFESSFTQGIVTISVGVSTFHGEMLTDAATIIEASDEALYLAKESGRNNSQSYVSAIKKNH